MSEKIRVVFMGTPEFALPSLRMLYADEEVDIVAVVTKPDRESGRGLERQPPPVKVIAENLDLPVYQPDSINNSDFISVLEELKPHFLTVVAYDEKLGEEILALPEIAPINLHPSLLPDLRGACPINWALIYGYEKTGITTIEMNENLDAGAILHQEVVDIKNEDNAGTLHEKLAERGAFLLQMTIRDCFCDRITKTPQKEGDYRWAPKFNKADRIIDWSTTAENFVNFIRGMTPYPGAITRLRDKQITIVEAYVYSKDETHDNEGEVCNITKEGMVVKVRKGMVLIERLKPEGSCEMRVWDFYNGGGVKSGDIFASRDEVLSEMGLKVEKKRRKPKFKGIWKRFWKGNW